MKVPTDPPGPVVLLVEDEWLLRDTLADALRRGGLSVIEAANGEAALACLGVTKVDVLITDIRLGGKITGWEVAERCREHDQGVTVIYTTGSNPNRDRRVAGSLFFSKPFELERVVAACRRCEN